MTNQEKAVAIEWKQASDNNDYRSRLIRYSSPEYAAQLDALVEEHEAEEKQRIEALKNAAKNNS